MTFHRKQRDAPIQDKIVEFIIDYKRDKKNDGNLPTYQEIADGIDRGVSQVYTACMKLVVRKILEMNERGKLIVPKGRWDIDPDNVPTADDEFVSDE